MARARAAPATGEAESAAAFLPARRTLRTLREAAAGCRGCHLYARATQTVFGEGQKAARLMLVGEMPGHQEDLAGHPFVGPAGRLLEAALDEAQIDRDDAYVTNVVKHFKWTPKGRTRLHSTPNAGEIRACVPWLEAEIQLVRPHVLVCLGATAAKALLGAKFRITQQRGQLVPSAWAPNVLATAHPSSILRAPTSEDRAAARAALVADLRRAAALL